jgi:hypothetical protein
LDTNDETKLFGVPRKSDSWLNSTKKKFGLCNLKAGGFRSMFVGEIVMSHPSPSALVMEKGQRILLRLQGGFFELSQQELRALLGIPSGTSGIGISIDGDRFTFEFAEDEKTVEITAGQLQRRLSKQTATKS